jgi:hypothetical protein
MGGYFCILRKTVAESTGWKYHVLGVSDAVIVSEWLDFTIECC